MLAPSLKSSRIALVGLPGSGKTTVGRHLARRLNARFIDSDQVIEQQVGCSIRSYFASNGEVAFRKVEASAIDALTLNSGNADSEVFTDILSTGGGAVLLESNRLHLHSRTHVIYLHASVDDLAQRLRYDQHRPLLQVADPKAKIAELYAQRDSLYRQTAHWVVDTGKSSVHALVHDLVTRLLTAKI